MTTPTGLTRYSVRERDLYDEHVLEAGAKVYLAADVALKVVPLLRRLAINPNIGIDLKAEAQRLLGMLEGKL